MDLRELYGEIGGDYEQAIRVLRMDKLIEKHIRKLADNGVVDRLIAAGNDMDPTELFESAHAVKGVCANLGLVGIADIASEISEEYRPGSTRTLSDAEVKMKLAEISGIYERTLEGIGKYGQS